MSVFFFIERVRCQASHSVGTDDHEQRESRARSIRQNRAKRTSHQRCNTVAFRDNEKMRCIASHSVGTDDRT